MSDRLQRVFRKLRAEKRCGLIAYVTCGDPDRDTTVQIVLALAAAGADAIELGIPFSDPIADGPVIQAAALRALKSRTSVRDVLGIAAEVRRSSEVPLIAFSYLNPILRYGIDRFARDAAAAGIDSLLLTDLPAERSEEIRPALKAHGMGAVFLLAPTSTAARLGAVNRASDDFVYYVSTMGVTGARSELDPALLTRLDEIRSSVRRPLAVGFGISRHEHYETLRTRCDAVVVGSAIVRAIADGTPAGAAGRAAEIIHVVLGKK